MFRPVFKLLVACLVLSGIGQLLAEDFDPAAIAFFESEVRPLLVERCHKCHGDVDDPKGGLKLISRAAVLAGGESGAGAVPGKPKESLIVEAVQYHETLRMPPDAKLKDADIQRITRWVELGLPWPGGAGEAVAPSAIEPFVISQAQREFWSFQPIKSRQPPAVRAAAWPLMPIDHFVLAALEAKNLNPNGPADKRTLLRRATFDLTGLPPTPDELAALLADNSPEAFPRVVERLLASPAYGERWGRHWLDVVRYADTAGETADYPVPQAYRYRNYVIDAFNSDKPYDQFLREQVAGDLLAPLGPREQYAERIAATGFLAISRRFGFDSENYHHLTIADTLDVLGRSVLGLSLGCARCHDHKYDPISTADYYALYGIFESSRYAFPGSEEKHSPRDFVPMLPAAEAQPLLAAFQAKLAAVEGELKQCEAALADADKALKSVATAPAGTDGSATTPATDEIDAGESSDPERLTTRRAELEKQAKRLREQRDELVTAGPYELAYGVIEGEPHDARIQKRGEPTRLGAEVPRRFLEILGGDPLRNPAIGSGRRELAHWLTRPSNPLTARVIVNRVWQYHFGRGLASSAGDFGLRGPLPSHPELLDYLADRFMANGWSLKWLHRQLMQSRTYQMSSSEQSGASAVDPANLLWWKMDRRRLEAEALRDAVLAVSGQLDRSPGGAHPFPPQTKWNFTQHAPFKALYASDRRSVYLMTQRVQRHPLLALFDAADPNVSTSQRLPTTTPAQALFMMNDPLVHEQSTAMAVRVLRESAAEADRVDRAHLLALSRTALPEEQQQAAQFLQRYRQEAGGDAANADLAAWSAYVRTLLASNEFMFID